MSWNAGVTVAAAICAGTLVAHSEDICNSLMVAQNSVFTHQPNPNVQVKAGMLSQLLAACRQHAGDVFVQEAALSSFANAAAYPSIHPHLLAQNVLTRSVVVCSTFVSNEGITLSAAALFQNMLTLPCDNILGERHFFSSFSEQEIVALLRTEANGQDQNTASISSFDATIAQQRDKEARAVILASSDILAVIIKGLVTFAENPSVIAAIGRCLAVLLQSHTMRIRLMQQHSDFIDVSMRLWLLYSDHSDTCAAFASMYGSFTSLCASSVVAAVESAGVVPLIMRALVIADKKLAAVAADGNGSEADEAVAYAEDVLWCVRCNSL
jgi:hypothetical protein